MAKPLVCLRCGTALGDGPPTGRPPRYCSDLCKRLTEYEVRRLDRRLSAYEVELREELADRTPAADAWIDKLSRTRAQRIADLRRWIAADTERLQLLLGGGQAESPADR